MVGEPIRNKVSGEESRAQIVLPDGFEYEVADIGSASSRTTGGRCRSSSRTATASSPTCTSTATASSAPDLTSRIAAPASARSVAARHRAARRRSGWCVPRDAAPAWADDWHGDGAALRRCVLMWWVMMVAMMLPSRRAGDPALRAGRDAAHAPAPRSRRPWLFVAGYLPSGWLFSLARGGACSALIAAPAMALDEPRGARAC